jgi:peptidoglycan/LPS O-acetylase OafA/YrhL
MNGNAETAVSNNNKKAEYLGHIDGLRAIAIILVMLFHFELGGIERGFLGVDIFFVISGFLVCGLIFRANDSGSFKLFEFYRRRITRILPAFTAIALSTIAVGWLILLPNDFVRLAKSLEAAALLSANNHFYLVQGYFEPGKYDTFFLHGWSLSVEEQFYIVFPLMAVLIGRFSRWRTVLIGCTAVASFVYYLWLGGQDASAAFYLMHARAWELLAGAMLASVIADGGKPVFRGPIVSVVGLTMMISPALIPGGNDFVFSTILQLSCVVGTLCVLSANLDRPLGILAQSLATAPMRFIGRISYSAYLIHWPMITLAKYWAIVPISSFARMSLFVASLLLAWGSWRWIEVPTRAYGNKMTIPLLRIFGAGAAAILLLVGVNRAIVSNAGMPERFGNEYAVWLKGAQDFSVDRTRCHSSEDANPIHPGRACILGAPAIAADVAFWADSYGTEIARALADRLTDDRRSLVQMTSSACPPIESDVFIHGEACRRYNVNALASIRKSDSIRTVVMTMAYSGYDKISLREKLDGFEKSVRSLRSANKHVIILGQYPQPPYNVPTGFARQAAAGYWHAPTSIPLSDHIANTRSISNGLRKIANRNGASFVDPMPALCDRKACPLAVEKVSLYYDQHHPSMAGARRVAKHIWPHLALQ